MGKNITSKVYFSNNGYFRTHLGKVPTQSYLSFSKKHYIRNSGVFKIILVSSTQTYVDIS